MATNTAPIKSTWVTPKPKPKPPVQVPGPSRDPEDWSVPMERLILLLVVVCVLAAAAGTAYYLGFQSNRNPPSHTQTEKDSR
jgi:hypothetical protein